MDNDTIRQFANQSGALEVWRSWQEHMLAQGRHVESERLSWDTLPEQDRELDRCISYDAIIDFVAWLANNDWEIRSTDEIAEIEAERDRARRMEKAMHDELVKYIQSLSDSGAEKRRMREALEFYADPKNHQWQHLGLECQKASAVYMDSGAKARRSLER